MEQKNEIYEEIQKLSKELMGCELRLGFCFGNVAQKKDELIQIRDFLLTVKKEAEK